VVKETRRDICAGDDRLRYRSGYLALNQVGRTRHPDLDTCSRPRVLVSTMHVSHPMKRVSNASIEHLFCASSGKDATAADLRPEGSIPSRSAAHKLTSKAAHAAQDDIWDERAQHAIAEDHVRDGSGTERALRSSVYAASLHELFLSRHPPGYTTLPNMGSDHRLYDRFHSRLRKSSGVWDG
jgi:hypothetical protein